MLSFRPEIPERRLEDGGFRKEDHRRRDQSQRRRTDPRKKRFDNRIVLENLHEVRDQRDHDQRRRHHAESPHHSSQRSPGDSSERLRPALIADIRCGVQSHRTGRHLRQRHKVRELLVCHEVPVVDQLHLKERNHRIASAEREKSDLRKQEIHLEKIHFPSPPAVRFRRRCSTAPIASPTTAAPMIIPTASTSNSRMLFDILITESRISAETAARTPRKI